MSFLYTVWMLHTVLMLLIVGVLLPGLVGLRYPELLFWSPKSGVQTVGMLGVYATLMLIDRGVMFSGPWACVLLFTQLLTGLVMAWFVSRQGDDTSMGGT